MIDVSISECSPAVSFLPITAVLEMTYKCNHKCIFCSCPWENDKKIFKTKKELNTEEWKEAIQKISSLGIANICFTGGEALLRDDLWEIVEFTSSLNDKKIVYENDKLDLKEKPIKLYLISNGFLVTKNVLNLCKKYNVQLSMSMPGLKTFAEHTGGGDPDKVLNAFTLAKSLGLFTVVNVTITKKNVNELYETIAAAFLAGAGQLLVNVFLKGGRGLRYSKELSLSAEEIIYALDQVEQVIESAGRFGSIGTELPKCLLKGRQYKKLDTASMCSAALGFFVVGPSGYIRVCNHSQVNLCHYRDIEQLNSNDYWQKYTQKKYLPKECYSCSDIGVCDGGCREEAHIVSGKIDSVNELVRFG